MKVGIIGAGRFACALAERLIAGGHEVMLSNSRGPETIESLAAELGAKAGTAEQAAEYGEVVALALPFFAREQLPAQALRGKVMIDIINYYPNRDGIHAELEEGRDTTSEIIARLLPGSRLVKAFNAIMAADLRNDWRPAGSAGRRALPIAGDDRAAKQLVAGLVDDCGFDAVDAGPLAEGWRFERARPVYCVPLDATNLLAQLAETERDSMVPEGSWHRKATS